MYVLTFYNLERQRDGKERKKDYVIAIVIVVIAVKAIEDKDLISRTSESYRPAQG